MSQRVRFTSIVEQLPATTPFVGPEALERRLGKAFDVRVGANESASGSRRWRRRRCATRSSGSPGTQTPRAMTCALRSAGIQGVQMDELCLAGGIDELLGLMVRMLIEPGTRW